MVVFRYRHGIIRSGRARLRLVAVAMSTLLAAAACSGDDDGESVIGLGQTAIGTCLDVAEDVGADIDRLPVVPCEEEHTHEIFAVVESAESTYPGLEDLEAEAQALCFPEFEDYVGISAFDSELFYSWLVPTLTSWENDDDREIVCVVGETNAAPTIGSLRNAAR